MGWDITNHGEDDFDALGLFLFTLRNGSRADLRRGGGMCYAEKLLNSRAQQINTMHTHGVQAEDIINRRGATLAIELFGSDEAGQFDATNGVWHAFWGEGGDVLIGEVSTENDDLTDNILRDPIGRFANIEEDEAPTHLLVSDYTTWLS